LIQFKEACEITTPKQAIGCVNSYKTTPNKPHIQKTELNMPKQFILLQTYLGASNYFYEVKCDGESITRQEAIDLGFVTETDFNKHASSDYGPVWYKIEPGNKISIEIIDGDHCDNYYFLVPKTGLPSPPIRLSDPYSQNLLHKYLLDHCPHVHTA